MDAEGLKVTLCLWPTASTTKEATVAGDGEQAAELVPLLRALSDCLKR